MTGKNSNLVNKFIIQLTPSYRIRIDRLNCTLMKRKTRKNIVDAVDEEVDNGYIPLGYYSATKPDGLVRGLVIDHVITKGSRNHLKLQEFIELFNSHVNKLSTTIGKITNVANGYVDTNNKQAEKIIELEKQVRIMKGQITKLKRGNNVHNRTRPKHGINGLGYYKKVQD